MICVPVGKPTIRGSFIFGTKNTYIDYHNQETIYPETSIDSLIEDLMRLKKLYGETYSDMKFEAKRDCGCYHDCTCSPSYVLYGTREEEDVEVKYREEKEAKDTAERDARDLAAYEALKAKFEKGDK